MQIRMSSVGYCERKIAYGLINMPQAEMRRESSLTLELGSVMEEVILKHVAPETIDRQIELVYEVHPDLRLVGHPDGFIGKDLVEVKTMASYSFRKAKKEGIVAANPQYIRQVAAYAFASESPWVRFICFNKDSSEIYEEALTVYALAPVWEEVLAKVKRIYQRVTLGHIPMKNGLMAKWECDQKYCLYHGCHWNTFRGNGKKTACKPYQGGK